MKHLIVTRCKFGKDEQFENYFKVMKKTYIPSINSQTDKNFSIALIVNPKHFDIIRSEIDNSIEILSFSNTKKDYKDFVVKNNITIQTRHDCDDVMVPNYIEYIHNLYNENKDKYDNFILNFHPTKLVVDNGKEYTHGRDYSKVCSMFSTLIQKKVHSGIYIPRGYVKLGIHGNNTISKLTPNNKLLN
jgi:hypothetical protein